MIIKTLKALAGLVLCLGLVLPLAGKEAEKNKIVSTGLVIPHIAFGGSEWKTTFVFTNTSTTKTKTVTLLFADDFGNPMPVPINGRLTTMPEVTIAPHGTAFLETSDAPYVPPQTGWAALVVDDMFVDPVAALADFAGFAIFRQRVPGRVDFEATVPVELVGSSALIYLSAYILPYDQTSGHIMGAALANVSMATTLVGLRAYDESGILVDETTFLLPAYGHRAFAIQDMLQNTRGRRGHISIQNTTTGFVFAMGLRFAPNWGPFTTVFAIDSLDAEPIAELLDWLP